MATHDKIQIKVIGEAAEGVTGSCIWVKTPHIEFLIECGLYQCAGDTLVEYKINNAPFKFKPKNISYVFGAHCHGDHILRFPLLMKRGCMARIIMPEGSRDIAQILMEDCAKIMETDARDLSKRYKRDYSPIYDLDDVQSALNALDEYPMNTVIQLSPYLKFKFVPSAHILNAAQIELYVTEGNVTKTIAYTSDLGNLHIKRNFVNEFEPIQRANILIGETTYSGETKIATQATRNKDIRKLRDVITSVCCDGDGRVLIPCFANARSQELLMSLYDIFGADRGFKIPVLFDTPMGIKVCEAYRGLLTGDERRHWDEVMSWENVKFITDPYESKAWRESSQPAVIISSSGMLTYGRSREYVKALLPHPNNMIVFCGFSVENSLASIIKEGKAKTIKMSGKQIPNRCKIVNLTSFSSHMQRDSLLDYYSSVDCEKVLLVHGNMKDKLTFAKDLETMISKKNRCSKVVCVTKGYSISV